MWGFVICLCLCGALLSRLHTWAVSPGSEPYYKWGWYECLLLNTALKVKKNLQSTVLRLYLIFLKSGVRTKNYEGQEASLFFRWMLLLFMYKCWTKVSVFTALKKTVMIHIFLMAILSQVDLNLQSWEGQNPTVAVLMSSASVTFRHTHRDSRSVLPPCFQTELEQGASRKVLYFHEEESKGICVI